MHLGDTHFITVCKVRDGGFPQNLLSVHDVEQQRHLSLMALELLADIIPSTASNPIFGMRLVPHVMGEPSYRFQHNYSIGDYS